MPEGAPFVVMDMEEITIDNCNKINDDPDQDMSFWDDFKEYPITVIYLFNATN